MENEINTIKVADLSIKPELGEVKVNNKTVRLGPVNMKVLLKLVNQPNKVVSRAELFESVWKNQIISDDALTKSISEIRTKLGQYSSYKNLILTIPKKGYQWCPSTLQKIQKKPSIKPHVKNVLLVFVILMILIPSFLWVANKSVEIKYLPILLLPIETYDEKMEMKKENFEDLLRKNIIKTKSMRFISKAALRKNSQHSIFKHSIIVKTQWAIEGRIRKINNKSKYTLSLIDTRTALEIYSQSIKIDESQNGLDDFCLGFIRAIDERL